MIERQGPGAGKAIATMSKDESLDSASGEFDRITYSHWLEFENRRLKRSSEDFQQLFEDIMVRARPGFTRIRPYGRYVGDRKCDGFLPADGTVFQVYSPDELKQAEVQKKINEDLKGAVEHWGDSLKKWVFVYNVRRGLAPDIVRETLQEKRKQYPNITLEPLSNDDLWKIACELSLQERAEILGVPVFEDLALLGFKPEKNAVCQFLGNIENDERFNNIDFFHTPQKVVLKEQYISIKVTLDTKRKDVESFWGYVESETELKRAYALKGTGEESQRSQVDWKEARKQYQRLMVLADPGMGKSTLLKMEAETTAQREKQKLLDNEITVDEVVFPLFLRLSDLIDEKVEEIFQAEIIDIIPVLLQRNYPKTAATIQILLKDKLEKGKCVLLLDALDEVPGEHRNRLKDKLNRVAVNYPCPIICTSRIVGYGGAFVKGAKEVEIVPFSHKQTEEYIEIWFKNAAGYIDDSVSAKGLIQELRNKPQIGGLAQNPLLLSLLCSLYQEKGLTLPARRTQVYEKAVDCMLQKWSQNRKPLSEGKIRAKVRLLEELAYHFSCKDKEIFSSDELYDWIEEYLQGEKVPTVFRKTDTGELIAELSEEDGILQKLAREGDRYLFLHRTFQEYLTACYLNRARDSIALAKAHFWEYEWHETLSLLAGLMQNPVPLLQAITAEKDDIFSTLLLLAGRCIAECQENSHPLMAEIIDRIYKLWQSYPHAGYIQAIIVAIGQGSSLMLERLLQDLNHDNSDIKKAAAWALGQVGNCQTVPALISALKDEDREFRYQVVGALGWIGNPQAIQELISALDREDGELRYQVIGVLSWTNNLQVEAALISVLEDKDWRVRVAAAEALGRMGNPQAIPTLISVLEHEDEGVRLGVVWSLEQVGNPQAVPALISALKDKDGAVRQNAAEALGLIGNLQAVEALKDALHDEDIHVRVNAALALDRMGNSQAVQALISACSDEDINVRITAIQALGRMTNPQAVRALIAVLQDTITAMIDLLGRIGDSKEISPLTYELPLMRWAAASALARMGVPQIVEELISALNNEDIFIKNEAAFALMRALGENTKETLGQMKLQVVQQLIFALKDEDFFVREIAAWALVQTRNPQTIPALLFALNDQYGNIIRAALQALAQIGTSEVLEKLIQYPKIDIRRPDILSLARTLAVRFSKEKLPFIPVYPELVAHKQ
jgi:HEAT repeat protein